MEAHGLPERERSPRLVARRLGLTCLLLALTVWSLSVPLRCPGRATLVGGFALLNGGLLGLALAMVTLARRPGWIYFWLLLACLTIWPIWHEWPLWHGWPIADPTTIYAWPGAPALVYNYYDVLRFCLFLLGLPYPFVRFGHHGPDPRPPEELMEQKEETEET